MAKGCDGCFDPTCEGNHGFVEEDEYKEDFKVYTVFLRDDWGTIADTEELIAVLQNEDNIDRTTAIRRSFLAGVRFLEETYRERKVAR